MLTAPNVLLAWGCFWFVVVARNGAFFGPPDARIELDSQASDKSPMQFVAAVNGTTALKLFTTLGWLSAFLVSNEEARVEFVFAAFGVFVLYTTVIVAATAGSGDQNQKN